MITRNANQSTLMLGLLLSIAPYSSTDAGLVGQWRFDGDNLYLSNGTVIDSSGQNNNGNARGDAQILDDAPAIPGDNGTCAYGVFDGEDDSFDIPNNDSVNFTGDITMALWVKPQNLPTFSEERYVNFFDHGPTFYPAREVLLRAYRGLYEAGAWIRRGDASHFVRASIPQQDFSGNDWIHLAAVHNGTQWILYRNGQVIGRTNTTVGSVQVPSTWRIGAGTSPARDFEGSIDDVSIFDHALSATEINTLMNESRPCPRIDYFEVDHDNNGIYCIDEDLELYARQTNGEIVNTYRGTATLDTQTGTGNWTLATGQGTLTDATANDGRATYQFSPFDGGYAEFRLSYDEGVSNIDIDVTDTENYQDDDNEGELVFAATGFTVTANALTTPSATSIDDPIDTQTAGTEFEIHVSAYGNDASDATCGVIESYAGDQNLTLTTNYNDPSSGTLNVTGGGTIEFTNGQAVINAKYKDVGDIRVDISDGTIAGNTNDFIVAPDSFEISLGGSNQTASDENDTIYTSAGTDFDITVTATDSEGDITPNYGNESTPETIDMAHALVAPSGGATGALNGSLSKSTSDSGTFSGAFNFTEVGIIDLDASISDNDYMGTGRDATGSYENVGRFTPYQFAIGDIDAGSLMDTCSTGPFTYSGEEFGFNAQPSFIVTAQNEAGDTTTNYTGGFAKLASNYAGTANADSGIDIAIREGSDSYTADQIKDNATDNASGDDRVTFSYTGTSMTMTENNDGTFTYTLGADQFTYTRNTEAQVGPFTSGIDYNIVSVTDTDDVSTDTNTTFTPIGTEIRFGRMIATGFISSELVDANITVTLQEYDADIDGFKTNTDENGDCTSFSGTLSVSDWSGSGTAPTIDNSTNNGNTNTIGPLDFSDGGLEITVNQSGSGNTGSGLLTVPAPRHLQYSWTGVTLDEDPFARIHFGLFSGKQPIIYIRQIH